MDVGTAWKVVEVMARNPSPGSNAVLMQGPFGIGKSSVGAAMAKRLVTRHGGIYAGWEAHDRLVVTDPPDGPAWRADFSDPRAPKVIEGTPAYVYRHMFTPGTTPLDYRGVTIPDRSENGIVTVASRPTLLLGLPDRAKVCILVLDEMAKSPELFALFSSLLHGGKVGDHELPGEANIVVGLSNRSSDRGGAKVLTMDLINRLMLLDVSPSQQADVAWARSRGVPDWAVGFAASPVGGEIIYSGVIPDKNEPFPSPRSWWKLVDTLGAICPADGLPDPDDPVVCSVVTAWIGETAGRTFLQWLVAAIDLPSPAEILEDPATALVPSRPDIMIAAAEVAVTAMLARDIMSKASQRVARVVEYLDRCPEIARNAAAAAISARVDGSSEEGRHLRSMVLSFPKLQGLWLT